MGETNRRLAGILAADVVGYSAMVGADEPGTLARVRALRSAVIEPLAATHGGRLFKTTGDGFFVAFASSVQALRCAIALQEALSAQPDSLRLRVGVHQGEVVAEGDDLFGDGVIVAARLEPLAEPGGICISGRVREDAVGKIPLEVDDLGRPPLKNITRSIRVFRVRLGAADGIPEQPARVEAVPERASGMRMREPRVAALPDPYVGRQRELQTLRAAFDQAQAGRGRIVMLAGEAGIGKTRTARELTDHAAQLDALVLWGHCHEESGAPPYWSWVQVIRAALRGPNADALLAELGASAGDIADVVPEIRRRLPGLEMSAPLGDAAEARFRMFDAIRQVLANLCRHDTVVIVLDNLHWADAPSLRLLEFLAPEIGDSRLLLVGTYRANELSRQHPLSNTLGALARVPHAARVHLVGLNSDEVHDFITTVAGTAPPAWLARSLHGQTEGNPLFLREIVRFLEQQGVLDADRATPLTALPPAVRIPEGVREVIGRRLNLLSEPCDRVLALAAVIGRDFAHDVLLRAAGWPDEQELADALDEALDAHVIEETTDGRYQFAHNLIRMTLYDELRPARRRHLHRSVGDALEVSLRGDIGAALPELARHFLAAGDAGKAMDYARRAGERAEALLAFEDAVQLFQVALDALEQRAQPDEAGRCQLLFLQGEALRKANDFPRALETLREAADLATALGEAELGARIALAYERAAWRSAIVTADPKPRYLLERALGQLPETQPAMRTQVVIALARALQHDGADAEAKLEGERALAMARQLGDPGVLASCHGLLDVFGDIARDEPLGYSAEVLAAARQARDLELVHLTHAWRFFSFLERGDIRLAEIELEAQASLNARLRQRTYALAVLASRITLALMRGELTEAERLIVQSMAQLRGIVSGNEAILSVLIFTLRREQGRLAELRPVISAFLGQSAAASVWRPGLALLYLEVGETDTARVEFERIAAEGFDTVPRDGRWLLCMVYLSEVCVALGDTRRAAGLHYLLLPYVGRNIIGGRLVCFGSADRYLGLLCTVLERWSDAERHFEAALALNGRIGALVPLAHAKHEYAAMLLERNELGDRERAALLLRDSLDSAHRFGMQGLEHCAAALLAQTVSPPATQGTGDCPDRVRD